jgi:Tol biopolymer transport system component
MRPTWHGRPMGSGCCSPAPEWDSKTKLSIRTIPQPYGEIFVMRYDGADVQQLTDDQWEEGTPAWQPHP